MTVPDAIPINNLADPAVRKLVADAAIVVGRDTRTGRETVFYGRPMLRYIMADNTLMDGEASVKLMRFGLDFADADELAYLAAAMQVLKGRDDYQVFEEDDA